MSTLNNYLKIAVFILVLVFLASFLIHKINLPTDDLGRHIKTGEIIWQTKSVPKVNLFSYAEPDHYFINHHWLSEVWFYWLYSAIGFSGLIVLKIIILLLTFGIVYYLAIQRGGFWWASVFGFLSLLIFVERIEVRPEIFSYLFIALYLLIFYFYNQGKKKAIWWLVPLQLIWVNAHIYFFIGPFLILCFIIQQIINQRHLSWWQKFKSYLPGQPNFNKELKVFVCFSVLVFFVLLINPNFIKGAFYPLFVLKNYGYDIVENKSPFFLQDLMDNPTILHFKILIVALVLGFILNRHRTKLFDFLTGVFAIFLGWFAIRNFPIVAMLALPVLAVSYQQAFSKLFKWTRNKLGESFDYLKVTLLAIMALFFCLMAYAGLSGQSEFVLAKNKNPGIGLTEKSEAAAQFYLKHKIQGPVFNNFDIGSYLDFYLYPQQQTFVDNRPEAFNVEFWKFVYIPSQSDEEWWHVFNEHYQFNSIFFGHTDGTGWANSFISRIFNDPEWVTIYVDKHAVILVKNIEKNIELIKQFAITPDVVKTKLNQFKSKKIRVDKELEEERAKGLKYINENFGSGIATF